MPAGPGWPATSPSGAFAWALAKLIGRLIGPARPVALLHGVVERGLDTHLGYPPPRRRGRRPGRAAQHRGGSAGVTLTYALTLACCPAAFDAQVPPASTVAVYLAGAAVASVSPTPGGLGAMEAALVAGLTTVGTPVGPAVAGVLSFRLLSFWMPILPGWLTYRALRTTGTI